MKYIFLFIYVVVSWNMLFAQSLTKEEQNDDTLVGVRCPYFQTGYTTNANTKRLWFYEIVKNEDKKYTIKAVLETLNNNETSQAIYAWAKPVV